MWWSWVQEPENLRSGILGRSQPNDRMAGDLHQEAHFYPREITTDSNFSENPARKARLISLLLNLSTPFPCSFGVGEKKEIEGGIHDGR